MAFHPPSLIEPGVSSPTRSGFAAGAVFVAGAGASRGWQAARVKTVIARRALFIVRGFYGLPVGGGQWYTVRALRALEKEDHPWTRSNAAMRPSTTRTTSRSSR